MARTMILDSGLPLYLWPEAINMAVEILNRLPTDALAGEVPYTLQDKQKRAPQMDFLCRFGQACIVHLPEETRVKSEKFSTCGQKGFIVGYKGTTIYKVWIPTGYGFGKVIESSSIRFDSTDLYENEPQKLQEDGILDFNEGYSLKLSNGKATLLSELGGKRTGNTDVDNEEPFTDITDNGKLNSTCNTDGEPNSTCNTDSKPDSICNIDERPYVHTDQSEFHKELLRAVETYRSLMHRTDSRSRTLIPCTGTVIPGTDSRSRAVILTQKGPSADSENDSEPGATNEPRAINRSRTLIPCTDRRSGTMIPGTDSEPRAMNSNGNTERIDPEQDLQITNGSNRQQSINPRNRSSLCPRRTLRPMFKVQENQLITEILQQSIDPRNRHALIVLMSQCTEDADLEEPKTLEEALSSPNRT